jgi:D-lactate dehydrogenase
LSAPVLEKLAAEGVKYIGFRTIGYNSVDLEAAKRLGIRVAHSGYSPYSVANYTVMLMLMCIRKALYVMMRSHTADYSLGPICGREMQNMTVGIIGTGRIGKAVIKNLSGFGCKIIAYDPYPAKGLENVEYVTLDELYARADIISLHTFLSDETYHMINKDSIAKMKDGVILINAARGALVDTKDLIEAVESGKIGSVGTDCCEGEDEFIRTDRKYDDLVVNHDYIILKSFQNTIVTPHVAFFTDQAVSDMVESSVKSVVQFAAGEDIPLEVH